MILHRLAISFGLAVVFVSATASSIAQQQLAVSVDDSVKIVDLETGQASWTITGYQNVGKLAYRADGNRLAVGMGPRIFEFETLRYGQADKHATDQTSWSLTYSPDSQSLAATFSRLTLSLSFGHLQILGPRPLDLDLASSNFLTPSGRMLPALAYRPGGGELAIATPRGFTVLSTATGFRTLATVSVARVLSLSYTTDGARLLVGTSGGFQVRNAGARYALLSEETGDAVIDIAVASSGGWVALVRETNVSVRRAPDLSEVTQLASASSLRDADFSPDGSLLAVAGSTGKVGRFRVETWKVLDSIEVSTFTTGVNAIAFRPVDYDQRIPVLFVHGHSGNSTEAWFQPGTGANSTSFAAALAANPQLPIDAFYLEVPVHDGTHDLDRGIADDAKDIWAMIEGGKDTQGRTQVGILNMPAYQAVGRVAIISYSQGTLSSRYYIKNLMRGRLNGASTVSEFVTLAAPNHGVGDIVTCSNLLSPNIADRTQRQLCAGRVGTIQNCGCRLTPRLFSNNAAGDETFISDLNGHPLSDTCNANASFVSEAPLSRPTLAGGILYVNLFGNDDGLVGGNSQPVDCVGRRRARNLAHDAVNREVNGIPAAVVNNISTVHPNVPHHFEVICSALKTVTNRQAPNAASPCAGLTRP